MARVLVRSDKDSHFTGALAQNVSENENLDVPVNFALARGLVKEIRVLSDQNLAWEVQLYKRDTFSSTDADLDTFVGGHSFQAADGVQNDGAGLYRYAISNIQGIYYEDLDNSGELHVKLVNRSAAAKNAGATGEVVVEIVLEVR